MADIGYINSLINGIQDATTKRILKQAFEHLLSSIRLGVPEHQVRATNLQAYWLHGTTGSDTSQFSIVHGLRTTPHYAIPILELDRVGSKAGFLTVSRAADDRRIYLQADSGSTNLPFTILVEN